MAFAKTIRSCIRKATSYSTRLSKDIARPQNSFPNYKCREKDIVNMLNVNRGYHHIIGPMKYKTIQLSISRTKFLESRERTIRVIRRRNE